MEIPYPKRKVLSDDDHKDDKDKVSTRIILACTHTHTHDTMHTHTHTLQKGGGNGDNGPPGKRIKLSTTAAPVSTTTDSRHHKCIVVDNQDNQDYLRLCSIVKCSLSLSHRRHLQLKDTTPQPHSLHTTRHVIEHMAHPSPPLPVTHLPTIIYPLSQDTDSRSSCLVPRFFFREHYYILINNLIK